MSLFFNVCKNKIHNVIAYNFICFFIIRYPIRWTDEAHKAIKLLLGLFGEKFLNYVTIVMTHGDSFKSKQKKNKKSGCEETFQEYIGKQHLGEFITSEMKFNAILLDNFAEEDEKMATVGQLFRRIQDVRRKNGGRYTNKMFDKAQELSKTPGLMDSEMVTLLVQFVKQMVIPVAVASVKAFLTSYLSG